MNELIAASLSFVRWSLGFGNASDSTVNVNPEVPGSTESTTIIPDYSANPAVVLQARSLVARSVKKQIVLDNYDFQELLKTGNALPNDILYVIDGNLCLGSSYSLTDFTGNLYVKNSFRFSFCEELSDVSGNIIVGEEFSCNYCAKLADISGKITAGNVISFEYCPYLANLSGNISNEGHISFWDCPRLRSLSGTISPGSHLYFWKCPQLTSLPHWVTTLGTTLRGVLRHVRLIDTGLSDALTDRLLSAEAPGMYFSICNTHRSSEQHQHLFKNFQMAFSFWQKLANSDAEAPALTLLSHQLLDLVTFLKKLAATADYNNLVSRPLLAQRIIDTLLSVLGNEQIQDEALALIHDAISSCGDRVILALDDLEILELNDSAKTMAIKHESPSELRALGLKMMRMSEVKRIARKHAARLPLADEVEVVLAYQIEIRKHLELPGTTKHMLYRPCAQVSQQDIDEALVQLNSNCGEEQLQEFLKDWEPWQIYQRHLDIPPFARLRQQTVDQIEECFIDLEINDEMVMLNNTHMTYQALCTAYQLTGNNPLTNTPLDWSAVVRLTEASAKIQPCDDTEKSVSGHES